MTQPPASTRDKIIKAAARVFARHGYEGASIRKIVARAEVNQAAINYHFGSKDGLYRAVLTTALEALMADDGAAIDPAGMSREVALQRFVRQQLRPLIARDEISHYLRIFSWEQLRPSPAFRTFMAEEAAPFFGSITALVRRFLPDGTSDRQAALGAMWLFGQCSIFVRNAEQLANPPLQFEVDEGFVDGLAETITTWAAGGLAQRTGGG